jgi:hypothetical protein
MQDRGSLTEYPDLPSQSGVNGIITFVGMFLTFIKKELNHMKTKPLLVAAGMLFGLSASAFAQATFQVGSVPPSADINTGHTELAGAITFTIIKGTTVDGTITISYGVPITCAFANVVITNNLVGGAAPTVDAGASDNAAGRLVIHVTAGSSKGNFTVSNVRVSLVGFVPPKLDASISMVGNLVVAGQSTVTVIISIAAGMASVTSTVGAINAVAGTVTTQPTIRVKEGFLNAFNNNTYLNISGTGATTYGLWLRFTLSALPPSGIAVAFPSTAGCVDSSGAATSAVFQLIDSTGAALSSHTISSTSTSRIVYYRLKTSSDPTKIETMQFSPTLSVSGSTPLPLAQASVSLTATFAPIGTAFDSNGKVITVALGKAPRFVASEVGPATLFTTSNLVTTLLIPFASRISVTGVDTAIALANTTSDPGTAVMGVTGAVKQSGTATFYLYPDGAPFSFPTGSIASGKTYTVLLSQLLAAVKGAPGDFNGYIIIVTQFTNAHGVYTITDFKSFSNSGQAMIISSARTTTPEALNH